MQTRPIVVSGCHHFGKENGLPAGMAARHDIIISIKKQSIMKKILAFVLAGMAINYFLDSERGNERRNKVKNWINDVKTNVDELVGKGQQRVENIADSADRVMSENIG